MPLGFKGGIHPDDKKSLTAGKPIEEAHAPNQVILPMSMHIGAMCNPLVSVGERVLMGQLVAESAAPVSAPIHASVSGTVSAIEPRYAPTGVRVMSIVIDNDFMDEMVPLSRTDTKFASLDADALAEICRSCGIVGLGGAAFPVSIKIKSAAGCVDTLIINGAECEPYITSDNRLIIEHGVELLEGATIIMKALGLPSVHIAIESNKRAAIEHLRKLAAGKSHIILDVLHTKYPQGSEKHLIRAITGREIPPGKLPTAVGAININVATAIAINRAVETGMPLIKKVVTVSGSAVANPKNLLVRIGTPIGELLEECGGLLKTPYKILMGGPMMGVAQHTTDVSVIKGTNAILAFCADEDKICTEQTCIRCGKCVSACPMNLMPIYMRLYGDNDRLDECEKLNISDCIECGCCSYVCPARLHLVQSFRNTKQRISQSKKKEG